MKSAAAALAAVREMQSHPNCTSATHNIGAYRVNEELAVLDVLKP